MSEIARQICKPAKDVGPVTLLTFPCGTASSALRSLYMALHQSLLYSSSPGSQSPAVRLNGEEQGARLDAGDGMLQAASVVVGCGIIRKH